MPIDVITFDLWDTIVVDNSDEPKRAARGLRSKPEARRQLVWAAFNQVEAIPFSSVKLAYDVLDASYNHVWHEQHVNWTLEERLDVLQKGLGRSLPADALAQALDGLARMEVEIPPDLIDDAAETLALLAERYTLAIVSDAIVTPGRLLRTLLENHGVKHHFSAFAFSDEVGHSKPHRAMFDTINEALGVPLDRIAHIGDRQHNDVAGAQGVGAKAVLFTASRDVDKDRHTADAVCERYVDLPQVIAALDS